MRLIEKLTVVFAAVAVLSPIFAVLAPLVVMRLNNTPQTSEIRVGNAWIRPISVSMPGHEMEGMPDNTAAYLTVENKSSAPDHLHKVTADFAASVEIHQTQIDDRGVAQMQLQAGGIEVPANSTIAISPGGYHIMLSGLTQNLELEGIVSLTLIFSSGKTITVDAVISDLPPNQTDG